MVVVWIKVTVKIGWCIRVGMQGQVMAQVSKSKFRLGSGPGSSCSVRLLFMVRYFLCLGYWL